MRRLRTCGGHVQKRGALQVSPGGGIGSEEFGGGLCVRPAFVA